MKTFSVRSKTRTQFLDITSEVSEAVRGIQLFDGVATVFCPHTTAGLTVNENADPDVVADLIGLLDRMVPWEGGYAHAEGNTAAHMKASMMGSSVEVIVRGGQLQLGTWQSIYFCEFDGPRSRQVWVTGATAS